MDPRPYPQPIVKFHIYIFIGINDPIIINFVSQIDFCLPISQTSVAENRDNNQKN